MRVVMVEVGRKACEMELEDSLASMQRAVGGLIQAVYEPGGRDAALICNEEGKLLGLPLNRALRNENGEIYDAIAAGNAQLAQQLCAKHILNAKNHIFGG